MKLKRIIIILTLLISISGCTNNEKNTSEIKTLDKAPDGLGEVYDEIGKVLDNVGIIERVNLDVYFEEEEDPSQNREEDQSGSQSTHPHTESSEGSNGENSEGGNGESHGSQSESNKSSSGSSSEGTKEEKDREIWMDIDKSIEDIHLKWSSYETEGVQKGASKERIVQLKDSINKLTKSIEEKDIISIYDFGSQSLLNLKPFYDLYKDDYRGEICELKYSIYQYYIKAISGDIEGAKEELQSKENNINRIRMLMGDNDKKSKELDKVSASIDSIGVSLEEGSRRVFMLEKDTLIKNLESLE